MAARGRTGAAVILLGIGLSLLLVNVIGLLLDPAVPGPAPTSSMIRGYDYAALPPATLRVAVASGATGMSLAEANSLVYLSLRHSDRRRIGLFENWLLWLAGHAYEPLSQTQDAGRIVAGGIGICSEKAQVLKTVAEQTGWRSRFVNLGGHVVLEVDAGDGWQVADPDFGVTYPVGVAGLEAAEGAEIMRRALAGTGHSREAIDAYVSMFQSAADNDILPPGRPLSPRLYVIEGVGDVLAWAIPLLLAAAGLVLARREGGGRAGTDPS